MFRSAILCGAALIVLLGCSAGVNSSAPPPVVDTTTPAPPADSVPTATEETPRAPQTQDSPIVATSGGEPVAGPGEASSDADASETSETLPTGTTVLQIGDSFAGALGIDLNRDLKDEGVRGVLRYETSTYIPTWAGKKELDGYLERFRPDLVLITLGANELLIPDPAQRAPTIHRLVRRLGGRPCVWVAPPLWDGARPDLLATIREACAPCLYLDSSALVPNLQRLRDHIHPSMQGRKIWAKAVLAWLKEHRDPHGARPWEMKP